MKLTIESTRTITTVNGQLMRVWEGQTESGAPCLFFGHVAAPEFIDESEFAELTAAAELGRPQGDFQPVPLKQVLQEFAKRAQAAWLSKPLNPGGPNVT